MRWLYGHVYQTTKYTKMEKKYLALFDALAVRGIRNDTQFPELDKCCNMQNYVALIGSCQPTILQQWVRAPLDPFDQ